MITDRLPEKSKIHWPYIILFYVIAFSISALFNSGFLTPEFRTLTQGYFISDFTYLPACLGTFIAALWVLYLDKSHVRTITFSGNYPLKNIATALTPIVVFSIVGLNNEYRLNVHYFAFAFAAINLIYGIMEEIGWRGYLQDALRPLSEKYRFLLIGLMWWAWHFRYHTVFDFTVFPLFCIAGSFLIGQLAEKTKSYLIAGAVHSLIILLTNSGQPSKEKIVASILTIIIWIGIDKWWQPETEQLLL